LANAIRTGLQSWEDLANSRMRLYRSIYEGAAKVIFRADNDAALPVCGQNLFCRSYAIAMFPAGSSAWNIYFYNDSDVSDTQGNRDRNRHEWDTRLDSEMTMLRRVKYNNVRQTLGALLLQGHPPQKRIVMYPSLDPGVSKNLSVKRCSAAQVSLSCCYTWVTLTHFSILQNINYKDVSSP